MTPLQLFNESAKFSDSVHFKDLQKRIADCEPIINALADTQFTVNAFIAETGAGLEGTYIADTFMMHCEAFCTADTLLFSVGIIVMDAETKEQTAFIIPFKLQVNGTADLAPGLYLV